MPVSSGALERLSAIPQSRLLHDARLAPYTRFHIGGPAAVLFDTPRTSRFLDALRAVIDLEVRHTIIGGGTNLIVSDDGFEGVVLRCTEPRIVIDGAALRADAGAVLQDVVDASIAAGLSGIETLTGIPGYLGGAIYGNAGAYGHSIEEVIETVHFTDGEQLLKFTPAECGFRYRHSTFKEHKKWIVLAAELRLKPGHSETLAKIASEIREIRDAKYPPVMRCAGSIFKNLLFVELPPAVQSVTPESVIREGKVPSAWFLEQVGAKGVRKGDIQVATYHANLIYNDGAGKASDLVELIRELKSKVYDRFGLELEEEVQYVGFN